jgi:hypothetical protein
MQVTAAVRRGGGAMAGAAAARWRGHTPLRQSTARLYVVVRGRLHACRMCTRHKLDPRTLLCLAFSCIIGLDSGQRRANTMAQARCCGVGWKVDKSVKVSLDYFQGIRYNTLANADSLAGDHIDK